MKLSLRSMVLLMPSFFAFGAFSHPGQLTPDEESSSVIRSAPRRASQPDIDELPLDLSMKSQNRHVSANTSVTHERLLQNLREFVVEKRKSRPQTRKPRTKLNLEDLKNDIENNPNSTNKERASRLGIALRTVYGGLKRLRSVSVNSPSCSSKHLLYTNCYAHFYADLREFVVEKRGSRPQTRKPHTKLNLEDLKNDIENKPNSTNKERASRLGIALRTVYGGLKRLRSVSVNSPSCSSKHLLYTNCYAHFYAALLRDLTRSESPPVAPPLQEKI